MLTQAARCKLRRNAFESPARLAEQLTLPWLCSALSRRCIHSPSLSAHNSNSPRPRRPSLSSQPRTRSLATTAELQPAPSSAPLSIFSQILESQKQSPDISRLQSWDPSNPLIVHERPAAPSFRSSKGLVAVGNDPVELHQNLYACLRVGRIDRAAIILKRLSVMYQPTAPELLDAHNVFLQTLFELAQQDPSEDSMAQIEQWYDANMVKRGVAPGPQTFVTLLRAAMNFLDEQAQEDAIRRYMAMAFEYGKAIVDEINYSSEFTDEEWDTLIRLQPDDFEEPPPVEQVQSMLVNTPTAQKGLIEHGLDAEYFEEIKGVEQKGLGLSSLKEALDVFEDARKVLYPEDMQGTAEEKDRAFAYARQIRMEQDALDAAVDRWKEEDQKLQDMGIEASMGSPPMQAIMYRWYVTLVPLFKKEIERAKKAMAEPTAETTDRDRDHAAAYGPWIEQCKPEKLAAITISRVMRACIRLKADDQGAYKITHIATSIGSDIMDYLNADVKKRREAFLRKQRRQIRLELLTKLSRSETPPETASSSQSSPVFVFDKVQIPMALRTRMGALAIEFLMQSATLSVSAISLKTGERISSTQAAFQHNFGFQQGKKVGYLTPHHQLLDKLRNETVAHIQAVRLPMVIEPKPWTSFDNGGYYTIPQKVVRQKNADPAQKEYAQSAIETGHMSKVLAGLDVLGKVPWQINGSVLNVVTQAWNKGMGLAGLIPEKLGLERPEEPGPNATTEERSKWGKQLAQFENAKSGLHSQRCFQNFQLETARSFVKEKQIFFPHSADFRGRAYPIPPTLNHIGADLSRGLLKFAHGKELGTVGLQWLKIHLANVFGYDKASLTEREQFAMDNIDNIYDSATNPLEGRQWWAKAEDPWQCLASCIELKNALDSPDPTRYVSQLPVHQDGTCNGLQHYAALGGDAAGARQVNLEPSDKPQDIYTAVADLVREMVIQDAAKGDASAKLMQDHITRKVVKRTVMTNVYGVTFIGAKQQVWDELKSIFPNFKESAAIRSLGSVALYIARKIFQALGKIFNGAQEIQYWLGECGERITTSLTAEQIKKIQDRFDGKLNTFHSSFSQPKKLTKTDAAKLKKHIEAFKTSIIWTTPLQMPIVQPYRKDSVQVVKTKLQDITILKRDTGDAIDKRKQLQAFPPNFIHSLDATHMLLSALKCNEVGLDFAAVHDSFWTHPSDIPTLNTILRDAFVRMHSEDIVARLAEEFKARYAGAMYCANIKSASEVGAKIRAWRVQFARCQGRKVTSNEFQRHGQASFEEVALESRRKQLLASEDPAEVEEGQHLVTPTSIWLENQDPKALSSLRMSLLGEIKDKTSDVYEEVRAKAQDRESETVTKPKRSSDASVAETFTEEIAENNTTDGAKKPAATKYTMQVWVPLTFPPVPKKGGWDVSRLRESKYFFS